MVYLMTNTVNGKRYVGKTRQKLSARMARHRCDAKCGGKTPLSNAIRKYGWGAFKVEILFENGSPEEDIVLEKEKIAEFRTREKRFGYNILPGGEGISSEFMKRLWQTPEYREKMAKRPRINSGSFKRGRSNPFKGKPQPIAPQTRDAMSDKISKSLIGNKRRLGVLHTEEDLKKMRGHVPWNKDKTFPTKIPDRIAEIVRLRELGQTQQGLAKQIGITQVSVGRILRKHKPSLSRI